MSIIERIQRIAKANIHLLLDKAEQPEQMLEQRIRELEDALNEGKEAAAMYGATFKRMEREMRSVEASRDQWQKKAEEAIQAGADDLARGALGEKIAAEQRIQTLRPGVEQGKATYEQLRSGLQDLQDQLNEARMKLSELKTRKRAAEAQVRFGRQVDKVRAVTNGGTEFEKFEQEVEQEEARVHIEREIREDLEGDDIDLEKRSREIQVEAQLREMKERLGRKD